MLQAHGCHALPMNAPDMVLHVVDPAEDPLTAVPFAVDARVVLRLVAGAILLAAEAALGGLGAVFVAAEEVLAVPLVVLAQIAAASEVCAGGAAGEGASPCAVWVLQAVVVQVCGAGRVGDGGCWGAAVVVG